MEKKNYLKRTVLIVYATNIHITEPVNRDKIVPLKNNKHRKIEYLSEESVRLIIIEYEGGSNGGRCHKTTTGGNRSEWKRGHLEGSITYQQTIFFRELPSVKKFTPKS